MRVLSRPVLLPLLSLLVLAAVVDGLAGVPLDPVPSASPPTASQPASEWTTLERACERAGVPEQVASVDAETLDMELLRGPLLAAQKREAFPPGALPDRFVAASWAVSQELENQRNATGALVVMSTTLGSLLRGLALERPLVEQAALVRAQRQCMQRILVLLQADRIDARDFALQEQMQSLGRLIKELPDNRQALQRSYAQVRESLILQERGSRPRYLGQRLAEIDLLVWQPLLAQLDDPSRFLRQTTRNATTRHGRCGC